MISIETRVKRILNPMHNFYSSDSAAFTKEKLCVVLSDGERCLGLYKNGENDYLLITDLGIYICKDDKRVYFKYENIRNIVAPYIVNKLNLDILAVNLEDGKSVLLPVKNGGKKFRDSYEFMRFLMRVSPQQKLS